MDPEQQRIFDSLDVLLLNEIFKQEFNPELSEVVEKMKADYTAARELAKDEKASQALRDSAIDICESFAKGLPDITRAAIDAAAAFSGGDSIRGSAAVMDLCAAVAPILGTVASLSSVIGGAGGPLGMLAGAVFSMVAQILMVFAPKGDSMLDQIEKLLDKMDEKKELVNIKTVQRSITIYSADLWRKSSRLFDVLQKPLTTHQDYLDFDQELVNMKDILKEGYPHKNVTMFTNWQVLEWLMLPENQDMDRWPEILGVFCKTYSDLMTANLLVSLVVRSPGMRKRMSEVSPESASSLSPSDKDKLETALNRLQARGKGFLEAYGICNEETLKSLRKLLPIARNRGLFFILAGGHVHAGTGKNAIERNKWSAELWNYCRRISITVAKEDTVPKEDPPLYPRYHFWALEGWHENGGDAIWHGRFDSRKLADTSADRGKMVVVDETLARARASEFSDIWALPAPRGEKGEYVYCSLSERSSSHGGGVRLFKHDESNVFSQISWSPGTTSPLMHLRLVTPFETLKDDPDKGEMPALLLGGSDHYNSILYGALKDTGEIYVDRANERCYVPSSVSAYSGIAVDPYLFWVFGPAGCACASHASIMGYLDKKRAEPTWLTGPLLSQFKDLTDLYSCEDKTLFLSTQGELHTTSYKVDFKEKKIVTEGWTKFAGSGAEQVQKMPIPCWDLFESLSADLADKVDAAGA